MDILESITYKPAPVRGGYTGRILEIDLSSNGISSTTVTSEFQDHYIGGRGYALKLLWDRATAETRFDSPENILGIQAANLPVPIHVPYCSYKLSIRVHLDP